MREELQLPPLPLFPKDPSQLSDETFAFLHSGDGKGPSYLALGEADGVELEESGDAFGRLDRFLHEKKDWVFGSLCYELKNELEALESSAVERIGFPVLHFFRPKLLFILEGERTRALYLPEEIPEREVRKLHSELKEETNPAEKGKGVQLHPRIGRSEYLERVRGLQGHIQQGDIYEVNFCQEFFHEGTPIAPYESFVKLQSIARAPMGAFYRKGDSYLLCASPERFLRFSDHRVIAQPIKGTAPRREQPEEDRAMAENLRRDPKERAENIMIVDLVRNDLSRTAAKGSVQLEELCGVHPFPTVHQMISTVSSRIAEGRSELDVIRNAFPMGSMTGAPKVRAMELIEAYEGMRRGLYSGSVGYFDPEGNGDFNVVIRSLLYNARTHYLSAKVGGAITARAEAEKEYEECQLKAEALKRAIA